MIKVKVLNVENKEVFSALTEGGEVCYEGVLSSGFRIVIDDKYARFFKIKLDERIAESVVYAPNGSFEFEIPQPNVMEACFAPLTFSGERHVFSVYTPDNEEIYAERKISLNPYDQKRSKTFPHAKANFVTREEPCFYERNAIDGVINNQGHGAYPFHSWAGGARNDLEFTLDFGAQVEVKSLVFYLRADFAHDAVTGIPHDGYWKNIDVIFDTGEEIKGEFTMIDTDLDEKNSQGIVIDAHGVITQKINLKNFVQSKEPLTFAALSQIEVIGKYISEDNSKMEIRQAANAKDVKNYDTKRLREEFHIANLFTKDNVRMVYSHIDRIITAGFMPVRQTLRLEGGKELASEYFLERREMGAINVGGKGIITVDGVEYEMNPRDGIYIGRGNKEVTFRSCNESDPAKFYVSSCPAHVSYPIVKIDITKARKVPCGSVEECNKRTINQYIHPDVIKSCQLAMGLTQLEVGSNWNTMPCHTHDRRMEVYLYLDMGENDVVFHMMGEPNETRHIIMHNEEAVISPSWSIHSGVGTKNYSFIWAMCGENQEFTDMDFVQTKDLL